MCDSRAVPVAATLNQVADIDYSTWFRVFRDFNFKPLSEESVLRKRMQIAGLTPCQSLPQRLFIQPFYKIETNTAKWSFNYSKLLAQENFCIYLLCEPVKTNAQIYRFKYRSASCISTENKIIKNLALLNLVW